MLMKNGNKDFCVRCPKCGGCLSLSCRADGTCVTECALCGYVKVNGSYRANQAIINKISAGIK